MKNYKKPMPAWKAWAASLLLLLAQTVEAEFVVDNKFAGATKNIGELTWKEQDALKPFFDLWETKMLAAIAEDNEGEVPSGRLGDLHSAHLIWNGKHYYAWAVQYQSAAQRRRNREDVRLKKDSPPIPGGGVCALYVFDENLNRLASLKIDLPENNHRTWCNNVRGLGGAGGDIDGMLVSLSYYLTDGKLAKRFEDIGKGWRYMTVLIQFALKTDGSLALIQDDSCFGNPNTIDNIPTARRVLALCEALRRPGYRKEGPTRVSPSGWQIEEYRAIDAPQPPAGKR